MALGHFGNFHPIDVSGFAAAYATNGGGGSNSEKASNSSSSASSSSSSSSSSSALSPTSASLAAAAAASSSDVLTRLFAIRKRLQELSALEKRLEQLVPYCERYKVLQHYSRCILALPVWHRTRPFLLWERIRSLAVYKPCSPPPARKLANTQNTQRCTSRTRAWTSRVSTASMLPPSRRPSSTFGHPSTTTSVSSQKRVRLRCPSRGLHQV